MSLRDDRLAPLAFLDGGGVTGQLIRSIDRKRTPRGPIDRWPTLGQAVRDKRELIPLDRDGSGRIENWYFKFNVEPMRNASGDVYAMMAVAVDITPQVSARRALEKAHGEREALLSELETAGHAKDEFLAILGHELRNPLAPILTALQLRNSAAVREPRRSALSSNGRSGTSCGWV